MNKVLLLLLLSAGISSTVVAQKIVYGNIRGKIVDTANNKPLAGANISLLSVADSFAVAFTTTGENGVFEIRDVEAGSYRLQVSFSGYQQLSRRLSVNATAKTTDLGTLLMERKSVTLQEVIVERPPITVKNDTVEYNAGAFKTKPNEDVEALLKKLPGVHVDRDGTVKSQGEQVQKVYVDGKEFFGTDPKLATKNLTADMVESVQVFDDMSDQAKFTKIDDGSRQKAMNIKLKKDKKEGYFGKLSTGAGTDSRYETSLSLNRFKGSRQVSVIGAANNTNKQGFSFTDIISMMGGFGGGNVGNGGNRGFGGGGGAFGGPPPGPGGGMGGGQVVVTRGSIAGLGFGGGSNGLTTSLSTGINYRDSWGSKIDVSGSYFLFDTKNNAIQHSYRQTSFPNDSTTFATDDRQSQNTNLSHRFNLRFEYRIDSMNSILYTPTLSLQHSDGFSNDTSFTTSMQGGQQYLALAGRNYNENSRNGINFNNNLLYRRRFSKTGRTLTLGWSSAYNHSNGNGRNLSPQFLFKPNGDTLSGYLSQDYISSQLTNSDNNVISSSYTEPIGLNKLVEVNYAYTNNQGSSDKKTNNYNSANGKYDVVNEKQTNYFTNGFESSRVGANFRVQQKKYNFQLGGAVQFATLESHVFPAGSTKDSTVKRSYTNFNPTAHFNYNPKPGTNFRFFYRGSTNQPSTSQLQNVLDVSNPQNIRTGNPLLKQEFSHNLNAGYNKFKLANFQFMAINFNGSFTQDRIANSIDTLGRGVQITKPVNLDGAYNFFTFFTYGKTMKKLKGGNINATTFINRSRNVSLLYKQKNVSNSWVLTQSLGVNYNHNNIDFGFNISLSYNSTVYSLQPTLNTHYYTQTYSPEINYTFFKRLIASTDLDYAINSGLSSGYNQGVAYWNASLALQVFPKKDGEIKLTVHDILNQNKSLTRSTGDNYVEDTRTNVLRRFVMLSFTYNFKKGSQQNSNMAPMPRMFQRGIRSMRMVN